MEPVWQKVGYNRGIFNYSFPIYHYMKEYYADKFSTFEHVDCVVEGVPHQYKYLVGLTPILWTRSHIDNTIKQ